MESFIFMCLCAVRVRLSVETTENDVAPSARAEPILGASLDRAQQREAWAFVCSRFGRRGAPARGV